MSLKRHLSASVSSLQQPQPPSSAAGPSSSRSEGASSNNSARHAPGGKRRKMSPAPSASTDGGRCLRLGGGENFELVVVGCGGGPLETNLSAYLVHPFKQPWSAGATGLEAGSTLGALAELVRNNRDLFDGFGVEDLKHVRGAEGRIAGRVWEVVKCFAISHAHLDHIQGLIISSGASLALKPIYGTLRTLENIDRIFDGGVWPRLAGWRGRAPAGPRAYEYTEVRTATSTQEPEVVQLSKGLQMQAFDLSHGMDPSFFCKHIKPPGQRHDREGKSPEREDKECYDSTAFFISTTDGAETFLFFGDVEPDSISGRGLNLAVWKHAAPLIAAGKLATIFLECSYPNSQPTEQLWGHLSPTFVVQELEVLAGLVAKASGRTERPLDGVTVVIIHIKDDVLDFGPPAASPPTSASSSLPPSARPPSGQRTPVTEAPPQATLSMSPPVSLVHLRRPSAASVLMSRRSSVPSEVDSIPAEGVAGGRRDLLSIRRTRESEKRRQSMPVTSGPRESVFTAWSGPSLFAGPTLPAIPPTPPLGESIDGVLGSLALDEAPPPIGKDLPPPPPSKEISVTPAESDGEDELELGEDDDEEEDEETVHEMIERELEELENEKRTGVTFVLARQGMRLVF